MSSLLPIRVLSPPPPPPFSPENLVVLGMLQCCGNTDNCAWQHPHLA